MMLGGTVRARHVWKTVLHIRHLIAAVVVPLVGSFVSRKHPLDKPASQCRANCRQALALGKKAKITLLVLKIFQQPSSKTFIYLKICDKNFKNSRRGGWGTKNTTMISRFPLFTQNFTKILLNFGLIEMITVPDICAYAQNRF